MSHNVVQSGLLWLRLVNTSMQDTDLVHNIGTGGKGSIARQMHAVVAALPKKAAAVALAEAGQRALANESDPAELAAKVAAAGSIAPPGPCDVGSLQRSLLIVHAPSAFDMLRWVDAGRTGTRVFEVQQQSVQQPLFSTGEHVSSCANVSAAMQLCLAFASLDVRSSC
jgi:hypothetical protein